MTCYFPVWDCIFEARIIAYLRAIWGGFGGQTYRELPGASLSAMQLPWVVAQPTHKAWEVCASNFFSVSNFNLNMSFG